MKKKKEKAKEKEKVTVLHCAKFPLKEQTAEWDRQKKEFTITSTDHSTIIELYHRGKVNTRYLVSRNFNRGMLPIYNRMKSVIDKSNAPVRKHSRPTFFKIDSSLRKKDVEYKFKTALNIDIDKAYAVCLFNNKFIDKKTLTYLCRLRPKMKRMKAVGMMATAKVKSHHKNGRLVGKPKFTQNKYRTSVVHFIQYEIGRIMNKIAAHYIKKKQFIFYWVDGIYLTPDADPTFAYDTFKKYSYNWETIKLSQFTVAREQGKYFPKLKINFKKGTSNRAKPKFFTIPLCRIHRDW